MIRGGSRHLDNIFIYNLRFKYGFLVSAMHEISFIALKRQGNSPNIMRYKMNVFYIKWYEIYLLLLLVALFFFTEYLLCLMNLAKGFSFLACLIKGIDAALLF
jgi:hypothetical protein